MPQRTLWSTHVAFLRLKNTAAAVDASSPYPVVAKTSIGRLGWGKCVIWGSDPVGFGMILWWVR